MRRWRTVPCAFAAMLAAALLAGCGGGASTQTLSGRQLLAKARTDAIAAGGVHEVISDPGTSFSNDNDIGTGEGIQRIVEGDASFTIIVLGATTYVHGNRAALVGPIGLAPSQVAGDAGRWIVLTASDRVYASVSDAVTLRSDFSQPYDSEGAAQLVRGSVTTVDGRRVVPIRTSGPQGARITWYVTVGPTPLPVARLDRVGQVTSTIRWTHWGERLHLVAPPDALSLGISL